MFNSELVYWRNAAISLHDLQFIVQDNLLNEDIQIKQDDNGIIHIYAENFEDLAFAQGFSSARERLFQMGAF